MKELLEDFLETYKYQKIYLDKDNYYRVDKQQSFIDWYINESGNVSNKTVIELSKDFEPKDSDNFKEWLKRNNITRDSNKRYSWNDMNYVREFFFDKFIEDQRREN